MIDAIQLRDKVIRPTLINIGLPSPKAEIMLLGTAAQESHLGSYLAQVGNGPALGIYQMEPATHNDIWKNYLKYKPELANKLLDLLPRHYKQEDYEDFAGEMAGNLYYATAMARVHYYRKPEPLPDPTDVYAQASYWKRNYNTHLGKGKQEEYVRNYNRMIATMRF